MEVISFFYLCAAIKLSCHSLSQTRHASAPTDTYANVYGMSSRSPSSSSPGKPTFFKNKVGQGRSRTGPTASGKRNSAGKADWRPSTRDIHDQASQCPIDTLTRRVFKLQGKHKSRIAHIRYSLQCSHINTDMGRFSADSRIEVIKHILDILERTSPLSMSLLRPVFH